MAPSTKVAEIGGVRHASVALTASKTLVKLDICVDHATESTSTTIEVTRPTITIALSDIVGLSCLQMSTETSVATELSAPATVDMSAESIAAHINPLRPGIVTKFLTSTKIAMSWQ